MWFMLGARVNKHAVIAHPEGRWAVVKDGEAEEQYTEDELDIKKHPKTRGLSQMDQRRGEKRRTTHGKSNRRQMGTNQDISYCGCSSRRTRSHGTKPTNYRHDRTRHGAVSELTAQTAGETLAKRQINHHDGNNKEEQGRKIVGLHTHPPQVQHLY